ncbi:hypothetical protein LF01B1_11110 [Limosilactobacillus fermentum]|uniref:Glycosyltransferase 2-like domain-containing protein n=1 Tax=Limosilactobacillus fermentum TaxID=1613 RepID=A0ABD0AM75_LIMFE|nr:hypothetical protein LF01B1_11110 [Limosilactobacillus fermentum]
MNFLLFSVLMSVYKKEEPAFLDQALESIEDQTVKPNQIVAVVDGPIGSELDAVLKEHQNQNTDIYTIVRSPKNQGLGLALRMGRSIVGTIGLLEWIRMMFLCQIDLNYN